MNEILRDYLERIGIHSGDDSIFVIQEMYKGTRMEVSRRYLECEPWKHLLDYEIVDWCETTTLYGSATICLFIQKPEKGLNT